MLARIQGLWSALFVNQRPAGYELLLFLLLANALHDGFNAFSTTRSVFLENDAFGPVVLGIEPVGWVAWFPHSWVLSHPVHQAVGLVAFLSALLWIFKRLLPWAPIVCALSHGLQTSLEESLMFNYGHSRLPGVALLSLYAGLYTLRRSGFSKALRERRFWLTNIYPQWVFALILTYMGLFYSTAGMIKILLGREGLVDGLTLQLLLVRASGVELENVSWFAQPLVRYRLLADVSMFTSVLLETGAMVAFLIPWLRALWAFGLIVMHTLVWISMDIPFKMHIALLTWMALPIEKWLAALGAWMRDRGWTICLREEGFGWGTVCKLVYAVDVLGILNPVSTRGYVLSK